MDDLRWVLSESWAAPAVEGTGEPVDHVNDYTEDRVHDGEDDDQRIGGYRDPKVEKVIRDIVEQSTKMTETMRKLSGDALSAVPWIMGPKMAFWVRLTSDLSGLAGFDAVKYYDSVGNALKQVNDSIDRSLAGGGGAISSHKQEGIVVDTGGGSGALAAVISTTSDPLQMDGAKSWDADGDGRIDITSGLSANEYVLAADLDGDGAIDPGSEFLSRHFGGLEYWNAFDALAGFDSNGDGRVDAADADFGKLMLVGGYDEAGALTMAPVSASGITAFVLGDLGLPIATDIGIMKPSTDRVMGVEGIDATVGEVNQTHLSEGYDRMQSSSAAGQTIVGGGGNDLLLALHAGVTLRGWGRADTFVTAFADTVIQGGAGLDSARFATADRVVFDAGAAGVEFVTSGSGNDLLTTSGTDPVALDGEAGEDVLRGGPGADVLTGGPGSDTIVGGAGRDVAIYRQSASGFTITATPTGWQVADTDWRDDWEFGDEGFDLLRGVEVLRFRDKVYSLNYDATGLPTTYVEGDGPNGLAPVTTDDTFLTTKNSFTFSSGSLLANDSDPEGGPLFMKGITASAGQLVRNADLSWTLLPAGPGDQTIALHYRTADASDRVSAGTAYVTFRQPLTDDFFDSSWHVMRDQIRGVWPDYTGSGVHVALNEVGNFDATNPEIAGAYLNNIAAAGTEAHGVAVASVLLAGHDDGGVVGVAPGAEFSKWFFSDNISFDHEFFALWQTDPAGDADIVNNSWTTPAFSKGGLFEDYRPMRAGLETYAEDARGGLGGISVFATYNNAPGSTDRMEYQYVGSARQGIAVNPLDQYGQTAYGAPGASLLISASGADMPTADLPGPAGYSDGSGATDADHAILTGSSLATPVVSGVVALMLEANPNLGYRDVQQILAYSARMTDALDPGWQVNGADDWNGGGLHWNEQYGFGRIDAMAAVRLAETWHRQQTAANLQTRVLADDGAMVFAEPDSTAEDSRTFDPATHPDGGDIVVDHAEVTLHGVTERWFDHSIHPDGLTSTYTQEFFLRSPAGTLVPLTSRASLTEARFIPDDWVFTATGFRGERAAGDWTLVLRNYETGFYGTAYDADWTLTLTGRGAVDNDTYVYTDAFSDFGPQEAPGRFTLSDAVGTDEINAAALSLPVLLDLSGTLDSMIGARPLALAAGTVIENAIGGESDDILFGNDTANRLDGARGDDQLLGRAGADRLIGGEGDDSLLGAGGFDTIVAGDGRDTVLGGDGRDLAYLGDGDDLFRDNSQAGVLGRDTVWAGDGDDTVNGGGGDDDFNGMTGADRLLGRLGNDRLSGGGGADTLDGAGGNDTVIGGDGRDLAYLGDGDDLFSDTGQGGVLGRDTVFGGDGNDTIQGGGGDDTFRGRAGNDLIFGRLDNDALWGERGADTLGGGAGADTLDGGLGADRLTGGAGADSFVFKPGYGADTVTDFAGTADVLRLGAGLWTGTLTAQQVVSTFASDTGDDVVFDFGDGDVLTLAGVAELAGLEAALVIL
ncbi:S8 family serine peptidase [Acidimangrovimonas pyrenivorans]|uniref:S8 family serine peptidase n=1 Tax=Acidimangrovimonas pyrenivorans TaxID=2030798 RepID=A0ABV7AIJ3_9RHOB